MTSAAQAKLLEAAAALAEACRLLAGEIEPTPGAAPSPARRPAPKRRRVVRSPPPEREVTETDRERARRALRRAGIVVRP